VDHHVLHAQRRHLRAEAIVRVPDLHVANDERVLRVGADLVDAFAEVEPVEPLLE